MALIAAWAPSRSMLGVCLGLQALVEWSGGTLRQLQSVRHGVSSMARKTGEDPVLQGVDNVFGVGHYHSCCADRSALPSEWEVTAEVASDPDIVLAIRHKVLPLHAVQFHPESVLTPDGRDILSAWLHSLA